MAGNIFRPSVGGSAAVLGPLESEVLNALWEIGGSATVAEIVERLARDGHSVHYSSAKTTLNTLTEKGHLTKSSRGKANAFTAVLTRAQFEERIVGGVLTGLMRNCRSPLIANLAETLASDDESLREFEHLLELRRSALKSP